MKFDYSTIEDKFLSLPDEVKFAMTSPKVTETIQEISNKFGLLLDQMEVLFDVTSYVMLGLVPQKDFSSTLARELNIGEKQARMITAEISDKVFSSIRESMREYEKQAQPSPKVINETYRANSAQFGKIEDEKEESPHADLENAGDFKIETTVPTELEMLQERREYLKKQRNEADQNKVVENPKVEPIKTQEPVVQPIITQAPVEEIKEEVKPQENFDAHSYYNFSNPSADEEGGEEIVDGNTDENKGEQTKSDKKEEPISKEEEGDDEVEKEEEENDEIEVKKEDLGIEKEGNEGDEETEEGKYSFDFDQAIKDHQEFEEQIKDKPESDGKEQKETVEEEVQEKKLEPNLVETKIIEETESVQKVESANNTIDSKESFSKEENIEKVEAPNVVDNKKGEIPPNLPTEENPKTPEMAKADENPSNETSQKEMGKTEQNQPIEETKAESIANPVVEEIQKAQDPIPKPIDIELNKLISQIPKPEEPKKDLNGKVAEETIKAIENNTPTESINLLDKQNVEKVEIKKNSLEPSAEELRNDIRSQIAQNNQVADINGADNFKQAEKMLEDKEFPPVKPHFISNETFSKPSNQIQNPINTQPSTKMSDPYREPVE